ncbi:MAG: WG repeat-containing protein, partial [Ferruginibacter sp.]
MKLLLAILLMPFMVTAQVNSVFVSKSKLSYPRLEYCGDGLFGFEQDGKIGYMNADQKVIIKPTLDLKLTTSDRIPAFTNGFAVIKLNGKQGLIDKTGKQVVPCEYNSLMSEKSSKTLLRVSKYENYKTTYGVLTTQNKLVIPIEYASIIIDGNLVAVKKDTKWGLMDAAGKELIPPTYSTFQLYAE